MCNFKHLISLLLLSTTNLVLGQLEIPSVIYPSGQNEHSITWLVEEGQDYRLESSTDLKTWTSGPPFKTDSQHFAVDIPRTAGKQIFFRLAEADISGPKVVRAYPADGEFGIDPQLPMVFEFFDLTAVDLSTFRITVSSSVHSTTFDVSHEDVSADEIEIPLYAMAGFHPNDAWAGLNEEVTVSISIKDTLGNETSENYTFTTQGMTTLAPETFNFGGVKAQQLGLVIDDNEAIYMRTNGAEVLMQGAGSWFISGVVPNFVYIYGTSEDDLQALRAELLTKTKMISSCTTVLNNQFSRRIESVSEVIPYPDTTGEFYLEIGGAEIDLDTVFSEISLSTNPWTLPLAVTESEGFDIYGQPTKIYQVDPRQNLELYREIYGDEAVNYLISGTTIQRRVFGFIPNPYTLAVSVGKSTYDLAKKVTQTTVKAAVAAANLTAQTTTQVGQSTIGVVKKVIKALTTFKGKGANNMPLKKIIFDNANVRFQKNIPSNQIPSTISIEGGLRPTSFLEFSVNTSYNIHAELVGRKRVKATLGPQVKAECDVYAKGAIQGSFELEETILPDVLLATIPIAGPVPATVTLYVGADFGVEASASLTAEISKGITYDKSMYFEYNYDSDLPENMRHQFDTSKAGSGLIEKPLTMEVEARGDLKCAVKPHFKVGFGFPKFSAGLQASFEPYVKLSGDAKVKYSSNSPLEVAGTLTLNAGVDFDLDAFYEAALWKGDLDLVKFNVFDYQILKLHRDYNFVESDPEERAAEAPKGTPFSFSASAPSNLEATYEWYYWDKNNKKRKATETGRTYKGEAKFLYDHYQFAEAFEDFNYEEYEVVIKFGKQGPNAGETKRERFRVYDK